MTDNGWSRKQQADWLRLIYRAGLAAGLSRAEARAQAHASVTDNPPF
jgi:hypothetical protein